MTTNARTLDPFINALKQNKQVKRWRLSLDQAKVSRAGFSKKGVADIYQPATSSRGISLSYAIEFDGQKIAHGRLNPTQTSPEAMLSLAQTTAITSPDPLPLAPTPEHVSPLQLFDPKGSPQNLAATLVTQATQLREAIMETDPKATEGELTGRHTISAYADSNDLSLREEAESFSAGYEYNGSLDASHSSRYFEQVFPQLIEQVPTITHYGQTLSQDKVQLNSKQLPLFIVNGFEILDAFLIDNLSGMAVLSGSSKFQDSDFKSQLQIAHSNFNLSYDQRRDMDINSFSFTAEGILGQSFDLIKDGRLTQPFCSLKSASRLGYTPRVVDGASEAIFENLPSFDELLKTEPEFLVSFHAMGVHSQNAILGTYSLPCPDTLYFKNGELVGPVKVVATGNFFDVLKSDQLKFVKADFMQEPLMGFTTDVILPG